MFEKLTTENLEWRKRCHLSFDRLTLSAKEYFEHPLPCYMFEKLV